MKNIIIIFTFFLINLQIHSSSEPYCNKEFLESYDIHEEDHPTGDKNLFCEEITENCCTYQTQLNIYKKWVILGERDKILNFYNKYLSSFEEIFNRFNDIEVLSRRTLELTEDWEMSNCRNMADALHKFKLSNLKKVVVESIKRAFAFFYDSRQGFYCSICNAESYEYIDFENLFYTQKFSFCAKMVSQTLNFYLFRYKSFIKIARLYAEFLVKCDAKGKFHKQRSLRGDFKFYKKDEIGGEIEQCKRGLKSKKPMEDCSDYCTRFNPTHFDENFEGELDKLVAFEGFLKKKLKSFEGDSVGKKYSDVKKMANGKHRVLMDSKEKIKEFLDNSVMRLNSETLTSFVKPLNYDFNEDTTIKYSVDFQESLMSLGLSPEYDFTDFRGDLDMKGIDFYEDGKKALIDEETARRVFELFNAKQQYWRDFGAYLSS